MDFDESVYKRMNGAESSSKDTTDSKTKKQKIEESETERQIQDLTPEQVQENYWQETDHTKIDGSFAMYETRVAKQMESHDSKDREAAKNEVKRKLEKKGVSVINTSDTVDMKDGKKKDDDYDEEDEKKMEDKKDKKDMDILKEENGKLKKDLEEAKKLNEDMKVDFKETQDFVETIRKEREAEKETQRQDLVKKIMTDFVGVTEEKLKDKTLDDLTEQYEILDMALKRESKEEEEVKTEDMQTHIDFLATKNKALLEKYRCNT